MAVCTPSQLQGTSAIICSLDHNHTVYVVAQQSPPTGRPAAVSAALLGRGEYCAVQSVAGLPLEYQSRAVLQAAVVETAGVDQRRATCCAERVQKVLVAAWMPAVGRLSSRQCTGIDKVETE